jgi:uncharacterized membrane protein
MEEKMKGQIQVLKTTVIGGIVFLVPIIIVAAIIGKAFEIMKLVAHPLSALLPIDSVGKIAVVNLVAISLIVLVCFFAGLAARTEAAARLVRALESKFLSHIPVYTFVKGMTASIAGAETGEEMTPVLARLDDYSQIAFEIERLEGGEVAVYLPGAPNPWSGSVCIMSEDRIQPINASMVSVVRTISHLGKGSGELLRHEPRTG